MATIPEYKEQVGIQSPSQSIPQLGSMSPASSGANEAKAGDRLGQVFEKVSSDMANIFIAKQSQDDEMEANNRVAAISRKLQEKSVGENGWLTRNGINARGILSGNNPDEIDENSFDGVSNKALNEARAGVSQRVADQISVKAGHLVDSYRNRIISHEVGQTEIARDEAALSLLGANKSGFAADLTTGPKSSARALLMASQDDLEKNLKSKGKPPEFIAQKRIALADDFVNNKIEVHIDNLPEARKIYNENKEFMSKDGRLRTEIALNGKAADLDRREVWRQLELDPKAKSEIDGTYDRTYVDKQARIIAKKMNLPAGNEEMSVDFARAQAGRADSDLADRKKQASTGYLNFMSKAKADGKFFPDAAQDALKQFGSVFNDAERGAMEASGATAWAGGISSRKVMLSTMNQDQTDEFKAAKEMFRAKYGITKPAEIEGEENPASPYGILLRQLEEISPTLRPRGAIREWANGRFKEIAVSPSWINGMKTVWKEENRLSLVHGDSASDVMMQNELKAKYGDDRVSSIRKELASRGLASDTNSIRAVLERKK